MANLWWRSWGCALLLLLAASGCAGASQKDDLISWIDGTYNNKPPSRTGKKPAPETYEPPIFLAGRRSTVPLKSSPNAAVAPTLTVDCKGGGNYKTITKALDFLVEERKSGKLPGRILMFIKSCNYTEKIVVSKDLHNLTMKGETAYGVYLQWNDTAGTPVKGGGTVGTTKSASVGVEADGFIAEDITFANTAPKPNPKKKDAMAVAYRISGDRAAHYSCRFFGWQDTLFDRQGRHYFYGCYIQGSVDFIWGNGQSIYESCILYSNTSGYYTAQARDSPLANTGFVFLRSLIFGDAPMSLGRTYRNHSRVIYAYCYLDNTIDPKTVWSDFGQPSNRQTAFYGEYKNYGPGSVTERRNNWTYILTDAQATPFLNYAFIDTEGWLPSRPPPTNSRPFYAPNRQPKASPPTAKRPPPPPLLKRPPPPPLLKRPPPPNRNPPPRTNRTPPPGRLSPRPPPPKKRSPPPKKRSPPPRKQPPPPGKRRQSS